MTTSNRTTPPGRWHAPAVSLACLVLVGCATGATTVAYVQDSAPSAGVRTAAHQHTGREDPAAAFLGADEAGLPGGQVRTGPRGGSGRIGLCASLNPVLAPGVAVDRRYSTTRVEVVLPGKGRIVQQGWVLPSAAGARALMGEVDRAMPGCRYSGTASVPQTPGRLSVTSSPETYPRDRHGWQGYRIEQTTAANLRRASVGTTLIVQRGPVVLALTFVDQTPKISEQALREHNMAVLERVLARA